MRYATDQTPAVRYDWATGLFCSWYMEVRTDDELAGALRSGKTAFLIRLKAPAPYLTERVAAWLRTGLRACDVAGVIGPDTFAVLMMDVSAETVERILQRGRQAIGCPLNASISQFPDDGLTFDTLLRQGRARTERARAA
jgi:hypothetical protein